MPSDFIIKTGDMIKVTIDKPTTPIIGPLAAPVPLTGSSTDVTVGGAFICLQGDELPEMLKDALPYMNPPFASPPGTGKLTLIPDPTNMTVQTSNGEKILIKGQPLKATFMVQTPAMQQTGVGPPVPDPFPVYTGTAVFITTNVTVKAG